MYLVPGSPGLLWAGETLGAQGMEHHEMLIILTRAYECSREAQKVCAGKTKTGVSGPDLSRVHKMLFLCSPV